MSKLKQIEKKLSSKKFIKSLTKTQKNKINEAVTIYNLVGFLSGKKEANKILLKLADFDFMNIK